MKTDLCWSFLFILEIERQVTEYKMALSPLPPKNNNIIRSNYMYLQTIIHITVYTSTYVKIICQLLPYNDIVVDGGTVTCI